MTHTPGPWWYDRRTNSIGCPSGWLGRVEHTRKADPPFGNLDDDGQLLAAAEGLLAACETALNYLEYEQYQGTEAIGYIQDLRDAIAQAKGEEA